MSNIVCCQECGRDTANKTRICSRCYGNVQGDEARGRRARSSQITGGNPIRDSGPEWWEYSPNEQYHGGSPRDDI